MYISAVIAAHDLSHMRSSYFVAFACSCPLIQPLRKVDFFLSFYLRAPFVLFCHMATTPPPASVSALLPSATAVQSSGELRTGVSSLLSSPSSGFTGFHSAGRPPSSRPPRGRCPSGPPRGRCPSGPPRGRCPSGPPRGRCPSGPPRGRCPSGPPQDRCPSGPPQGRCPSGPLRGRCPSGPPRGRCPSGAPRGRCYQGLREASVLWGLREAGVLWGLREASVVGASTRPVCFEASVRPVLSGPPRGRRASGAQWDRVIAYNAIHVAYT